MVQRVLLRLAVVAGGVVLLGLGAYAVHVGLDTANKVAGVIGAFAELVGLALSIYAIVLARRGASSAAVEQPTGAGQVVSNSTIGDDNIQIGSARDVRIHRHRGR